MLVFLWFTMVGLIVLVGFSYLGVVLWKSYQQKRINAHGSKGDSV